VRRVEWLPYIEDLIFGTATTSTRSLASRPPSEEGPATPEPPLLTELTNRVAAMVQAARRTLTSAPSTVPGPHECSCSAWPTVFSNPKPHVPST